MIVCIGDSITYGQYLADRRKAWPNLLRAGLSGNAGHVYSFGVSGDTTRLGLERFPTDVQEHISSGIPTRVIIQFGHNDCNRWVTDRGLPRVSPDSFSTNLEEMIERCRTFEAEPLLCSLTPSYRSERHAADVEEYDGRLRSLAGFHEVPLIDVRAAFTKREYVMDDGLHLTELGHRVYAEVVLQALDAR